MKSAHIKLRQISRCSLKRFDHGESPDFHGPRVDLKPLLAGPVGTEEGVQVAVDDVVVALGVLPLPGILRGRHDPAGVDDLGWKNNKF